MSDNWENIFNYIKNNYLNFTFRELVLSTKKMNHQAFSIYLQQEIKTRIISDKIPESPKELLNLVRSTLFLKL